MQQYCHATHVQAGNAKLVGCAHSAGPPTLMLDDKAVASSATLLPLLLVGSTISLCLICPSRHRSLTDGLVFDPHAARVWFGKPRQQPDQATHATLQQWPDRYVFEYCKYFTLRNRAENENRLVIFLYSAYFKSNNWSLIY